MNNEFHQHPDGYIVVRKDDGRFYSDSKENFEKDFQIPVPPMPEGTEHIFTQGKRHCFMKDGNVIGGAAIDDPYCTLIVARFDVGLRAKAARLQAAELANAVAADPLRDALMSQ